jgi:hypothetical protein
MVSSKQKENLFLGNIKSPHILNKGRLTNFETKYALYVPNQNKVKGIIKNLIFNVGDVADGIEMPFKANVYLKSNNSKFPRTEMIRDDIIVTNPQRKRRIVIDISKYNIEIPENGFFIIAETLTPEFYKQEEVRLHNRYFNKLPAFKKVTSKNMKGHYSLWLNKKTYNSWIIEPVYSNGDISNFSFSAEIIPE